MADATDTIPTWFKWAAGITAVAAGVGVLSLVKAAIDMDDPWGGEAATRKLDPEALEVVVTHGDEDDDAWYVTSTLYDYIDAGGNAYDFHSSETLGFDSKAEAVAKARELAKEARSSQDFKQVLLFTTEKAWRAEERRREAADKRRSKRSAA
jgi:hypothetical protein